MSTADRWRARYVRARARADRVQAWPPAGRAVTSYRAYYRMGMQHVAGSVTYFGIMTLFPLPALAYALAGHVVANQPEIQQQVQDAVQSTFGTGIDISPATYAAQAQASTRAVFATLGVTGLLYAGRLWVDAFRRALQVVWPPEPAPRPSLVYRYARDYSVLVLFFASVLLLYAFALAATPAPYRLAALNDQPWPLWAVITARVGAACVTVAWAALLSFLLFRRLGGAPPGRAVIQASWASGLMLAGLTVFGLYLLRRALNDPVYGVPLVIIGLMLYVSAAARIVLSLAVWSATGPLTPSADPPEGQRAA